MQTIVRGLYLVLVIGIVISTNACGPKTKNETNKDAAQEQPQTKLSADQDASSAGVITLAALMADMKKYEGKTVRVKGKCIKVNNNIMGRNWVHLQDESLTDKDVDLTITTAESVAVDDMVIFEGKITLNKDFGAGYAYDIIMEEAKVLKL